VQQASVCGGAGYGGFAEAGGRELIYIFEVEGGNVLTLAVFGDREVFFFQAANEVAFSVAGDDVDEDEFRGYAHSVLRLLGLLRGFLCESGRRSIEQQERGCENGEGLF